MKRLLAPLALLCALATGAAAQLRAETQATPDGTPFIAVRMPGAQTQSLQMMWRDAAPLAGEGRPGLPAAISFLMARGPKGEILGELLETLRDYQASFSVNAGIDAASIAISAPPEHFEAAVRIIKRFLDDPALPQDRLDTYRREYRLRVRQSLLRGDALASQLRTMALLPDSPLRRHHLSDPGKLDAVDAADVARWRENGFARAGMTIVTAGPASAQAMAAPIGALLDAFAPSAPRVAPPPVAMRADARTIALEKQAPQTIIQAFGPTGIVWGLDFIKAAMSIQRLGGGSQGRLHAALRDRLGATYGASVAIDSFSWGHYALTISTAVEHDKAAEVVATIREQYRRWWDDGMTEAEFAAVRSSMLGNRRDQRRQSGTVAATVATAVARGLPAQYYDLYDRALESVTRAEVNAYIKAHFPRELGFVVVGPNAAALGADCVIPTVEDAGRCGL